MKVFLYLSDFIVPLMIFGIVCYGIIMKIPVYDTFVKGAKDGFLTVIKIMPTMVGLMVAVGDRKSHTVYRISGRTGSPHNCKDVFLIGSDRITT